MVNRVRKLKSINSHRVMVAGDPEKQFKKRLKEGIPLNKELIYEYNELIEL